MQIELRQIQREVGITTVFVTHDQEEALTLADRIAILDAGRIVQSGPPQAVYERPRTVFAADFLGDSNFFTGRARGGGRVLAPWGRELVTSEIPVDAGGEVILAVRPEKLRIVRVGEPSPGGANHLAGTVKSVLYAGSTITYRVALRRGGGDRAGAEPGGDPHRAGRAGHRLLAARAYRGGEPLMLAPAAWRPRASEFG